MELHWEAAVARSTAQVTISPGENVRTIANRLEAKGYIRHAWLFRWYIAFRHLDTRIHAGEYTLQKPFTVVHIAEVLATPKNRAEREITIIPGWDLRDIATYMVKERLATTDTLYAITGVPAKQGTRGTFHESYDLLRDKPNGVSFEGYLAPDTYRIFEGEDVASIVDRLVERQHVLLTDTMREDIRAAGRTIHEVLTMASIVEREVTSDTDMALVADIFWRRYDEGWALQSDATVHYAVEKEGTVYTTREERDSDNPWNTYKYRGLPPGPIAAPSIRAIRAAVYPQKNAYWYFLTTPSGEVKYGKTFEEHQRNITRYLR